MGEIQIQTAEPLIPELTLLEIQVAIEKLKKKYKSPGVDQIPADLIEDGWNSLLTVSHDRMLRQSFCVLSEFAAAVWRAALMPALCMRSDALRE